MQSRPGQGSTFNIFIPTCAEVGKATSPAPSPLPPLRGGHESILVVEDEDAVRDFVAGVLESSGYRVISANSGRQALQRWSEGQDKFDLLLTDVVMPEGLSGRQLAEELMAKDPALRVIYTSGYSSGMASKDLSWLEGHHFLAKPYESAALLQRVRACLDGQPQSGEAVPATMGETS